MKVLLSIVLLGLAIAVHCFRFHYFVRLDERFYSWGKSDPFYGIVPDQEVDLGIVFRFVVSLVAILAVALIWIFG